MSIDWIEAKIPDLNAADGWRRRRGLFLSRRSLVILLLLGLGTCLAGYGYWHAVEKRLTRERQELTKARASAQEQLQSAMAERDRLVRERQNIVTAEEAHRRRFGMAGAEHVELLKAYAEQSWQQSLTHCESLLAQTLPADILLDVHLKRSSALVQMGRLEEALAATDAALLQFAEHGDLLQRRADLLLLLRRFEEAAPLVTRLAGEDATPGRLFMRASLYFGQGRYAEAAEDYQRVLESGLPEQERAAAANLAILCAEKLRDPKRAEFYATVLMGLAPSSYRTHATVGRVALVTGDLRRAEIFLERARDAKPQDVETLLNLALLYERTNRAVEAEQHRAAAAVLTPEWEAMLARLANDLPAGK